MKALSYSPPPRCTHSQVCPFQRLPGRPFFGQRQTTSCVLRKQASRRNRVARFFLVQHTKMGKLYQNDHNICIPNGHNVYEMSVKYVGHKRT
jgi:hypothetical protein